MWVVYAIAIILGGGSLLLQMLGSLGDHGGVSHGDGHADHPGGPGLLSTRTAVYGLFTFGFVGGLLHVARLASPAVALAVGTASAIAVAVSVGYTLRAIGHSSVSGAAEFAEARGRRARVLVRCTRERRGKIRVDIKGQTVDMLATTDAAELPAGADVEIVEIRGDMAHVAPAGGVNQEG